MPSEPSDGIFNHSPFTGAGRAQGNARTVIPDNTVILKPVIPAQAGIQTCPHRNLSDKNSCPNPAF
ncbi:hypothetical protein [Neisseria polysaccharea]|uniref:hypothetical protein n=1 Tax=Neisseria polysaccharea TaxID=489 RepID=UPI0018C3CA46